MKFHNAKIIGTEIDPTVYHRQEAKRGSPEFIMSRGALMEFLNCPSRWLNGYEGEDSKATDWGSLIDTLALSPERFGELYSVAPEHYPDKKTGEPKPWNWNATFCDEWRSAQGNRTVIKSVERSRADAAIESLHRDKAIAELIAHSTTQVFVMAEYHDADTKLVVPLKALVDLVPEANHPTFGKALADFKTAATANPSAWPRTVFQRGYDTQAALYIDLYVAATGEERIEWLHAIQESFPPYQTGRRLLSQEFIEIGRAKYQRALKLYCHCLKNDFWPGYDDVGDMIMPGWKLTEPEAWMVTKGAMDWTPPASEHPPFVSEMAS
jgi:hypothetical protein